MTWIENGSSASMAHPDDPRVVMVITRDDYPDAPYGDALRPAYYLDYRGGWSIERAGDTFHDHASDDLAERYLQARERFRYAAGYRWDGLSVGMIVKTEQMLTRWLRIFHGARAQEFCGGHRGETTMLLLDTPSYREHTGNLEQPDLTDEQLFAGEISEWSAYLDGDVYGVGVLVNLDHTMHTDDDPPTEDGDGWEFEDGSLVWGHYGLAYARAEAMAEGDATAALLARTVPMVGQ